LEGNNGDDILYGSNKKDTLFGDWYRHATDTDIDNEDTEGGDDIIYTGESTAANDGS